MFLADICHWGIRNAVVKKKNICIKFDDLYSIVLLQIAYVNLNYIFLTFISQQSTYPLAYWS